MANWQIDMGYDWNARPSGIWDGALLWGSVQVTSSAAPPATLNMFAAGDTLSFTVFDVSALTNGTPGPTDVTVSLASTWLTFSSADANTASTASPFTSGSQIGSATVAPAGSVTSSIFGGPWPSWTVTVPGGITVQNPNGTTSPSAFYLTFVLSVTDNTTSAVKTFGVDPEMIVKP